MRSCPRCGSALVRSLRPGTPSPGWVCPGCGHHEPDSGATVIEPNPPIEPNHEEHRVA